MRCVIIVRTDVSAEYIVSVIRMARIGDLGMLALTSKQNTLQRNIN
jgi:hypothetical protein